MRASIGRRWVSGIVRLYIHVGEGVGRYYLERHGPRVWLFVHRGGHVNPRLPRRDGPRNHHVDARRDRLRPELKPVDRRRQGPKLFDLLARAEVERLARADGRAHRLLADARAVVAHVALHHDLPVFVHLGHAERTGDHAVAAGDAAGFARRLHDAVAGSLDRVGRTHFRARRLLAVHADDGDGLYAA